MCTKAWAKHQKQPNMDRLANTLGLNKNMARRFPPDSLEQLLERISTRWYEDLSAGASADIQICVTRAGGHAIHESVEAKYCKMLHEDQLKALVTASCRGIFEKGVSPLDMIHAWNGETGSGQQVTASDEGAGYLVSLKGYSTDDFDVACQISGLMIKACSKPCAILFVWAAADGPVEMHALSVRTSSDGVIDAIDRQKGGSKQTVTPDNFVQLVIIDATITSKGEELDCDEKYEAAMDEVRLKMKEAQPWRKASVVASEAALRVEPDPVLQQQDSWVAEEEALIAEDDEMEPEAVERDDHGLGWSRDWQDQQGWQGWQNSSSAWSASHQEWRWENQGKQDSAGWPHQNHQLDAQDWHSWDSHGQQGAAEWSCEDGPAASYNATGNCDSMGSHNTNQSHNTSHSHNISDSHNTIGCYNTENVGNIRNVGNITNSGNISNCGNMSNVGNITNCGNMSKVASNVSGLQGFRPGSPWVPDMRYIGMTPGARMSAQSRPHVR